MRVVSVHDMVDKQAGEQDKVNRDAKEPPVPPEQKLQKAEGMGKGKERSDVRFGERESSKSRLSFPSIFKQTQIMITTPTAVNLGRREYHNTLVTIQQQ